MKDLPEDANNVIPIRGASASDVPLAPSKATERITRLLHNMLKEVESGGVQFVAIAFVKNGIANSTWSPEQASEATLSAALGAVNLLNHQLLQGIADNTVIEQLGDG
jgi:hypothetical protein